MANDRMYMRCKVCGDMLPLGKHFMDGWYNAPEGAALQEWIDKHAPIWVHEGDYDEALKVYEGHAVFEICYESDDDFVEKEKWRKSPAPENKFRGRAPENKSRLG